MKSQPLLCDCKRLSNTKLPAGGERVVSHPKCKIEWQLLPKVIFYALGFLRPIRTPHRLAAIMNGTTIIDFLSVNNFVSIYMLKKLIER